MHEDVNVNIGDVQNVPGRNRTVGDRMRAQGIEEDRAVSFMRSLISDQDDQDDLPEIPSVACPSGIQLIPSRNFEKNKLECPFGCKNKYKTEATLQSHITKKHGGLII